ncbi:MAG: transcriptional repressor [Eubacteriales bacterium]|nr:transcriptional repressor [Eubacteriales bacterium]
MAARGTYQTKQKETIAAYFHAHPQACVTAEEVYAALGADVGMTTVYRAITRLCEEGALRRYVPQNAGDAALYQLNPCGESHMHIRCVDCGAMEHLRCDVVNEFTSHLRGKHGFVLDESKTVLYGRCEKCEAKRMRQNKENSPKQGV